MEYFCCWHALGALYRAAPGRRRAVAPAGLLHAPCSTSRGRRAEAVAAARRQRQPQGHRQGACSEGAEEVSDLDDLRRLHRLPRFTGLFTAVTADTIDEALRGRAAGARA